MRCCAFILCAALFPSMTRAELALSAWVPNRWLPQGELRLYVESAGPRIEVVLHTRYLDRVVRAIQLKERENWGEHPEANRYLAALADARKSPRLQRSGARENLIIEFRGGAQPEIRISTAAIKTTSSSPGLQIEQPTLLAAYTPDAAYLHRNMALILADQLGLTPEAAETRLRSAGP